MFRQHTPIISSPKKTRWRNFNKLHCCMKLAFHFISWWRCAVKQNCLSITQMYDQSFLLLNCTHKTSWSWRDLKYITGLWKLFPCEGNWASCIRAIRSRRLQPAALRLWFPWVTRLSFTEIRFTSTMEKCTELSVSDERIRKIMRQNFLSRYCNETDVTGDDLT